MVRRLIELSWLEKQLLVRSPKDFTCLVQGVAVKGILRQRGIASTLYIGVALNDTRSLIAHAWVRCGPFFLTGGNGEQQYRVLSKYASNGF